MTTSLSSPLTLPCGLPIRNRFFKSAMSEQLGDDRHDPTAGLSTLFSAWARGGIGLAVTGNVMIDRTALGEPCNVVLDEASDLAAFERWAAAGTKEGARVFLQLNHPGKQSPRPLSSEPVAPSAIPLGGGLERAFATPRALTEREIVAIIGRFAKGAALAKRAGFSGVQIHGAHGYLVSQFLSPHHNQRQDSWGGSAEKRRRFVLDVYAAIRAEVGPSFPVTIKLNSADFQRGGFTEDESMAVVDALASAGIDLIEVSGGTYEAPAMTGAAASASTRAREAYFLEYAEKVRARVAVPLVVTGGFRSGEAMASALASRATDMIGLARPLCICPDLPNRVLADSSFTIALPRPSTGLQTLDRLSMLDVTWYEAQLARIARGDQPDETLSAWSALGLMLKRAGAHAFAPRRA